MMVPLSVEQYHKMIDTGILEEGAPIELLDGYLFRKDRSAAGADPMTVGTFHAYSVSKLGWLLRGVEGVWHYRTQQPITVMPDSEPEPDGAIVRGTPDDYADRHPTPADVSCLIAVADSSLRDDRLVKSRIYADARIPQYIIVNLLDKIVEVYSNPVAGSGRYAKMEPFHRGQTAPVALPSGQSVDLAVHQILP
jgi:Uma2 family endonuclease